MNDKARYTWDHDAQLHSAEIASYLSHKYPAKNNEEAHHIKEVAHVITSRLQTCMDCLQEGVRPEEVAQLKSIIDAWHEGRRQDAQRELEILRQQKSELSHHQKTLNFSLPEGWTIEDSRALAKMAFQISAAATAAGLDAQNAVRTYTLSFFSHVLDDSKTIAQHFVTEGLRRADGSEASNGECAAVLEAATQALTQASGKISPRESVSSIISFKAAGSGASASRRDARRH